MRHKILILVDNLYKTELAYKEKSVKMKTGHMMYKDGVKMRKRHLKHIKLTK